MQIDSIVMTTAVNDQVAVLHSNRAAVYLSLNRHVDALKEAEKVKSTPG